jgi:GT2 family glycosyltransferase
MTTEIEPPVATVVLAAHHEGRILGRQLAALAGQVDAPPHHIVLVLNRPSSETRTTAESFLDALPMRVVSADRLASAAYARNVGAALSEAPLLLFCDADDVASPQWMKHLAEPLRNGAADFVGGAPVIDRSLLADWVYERYYSSVDGARLAYMPPGIRYPIGASFGVRRDRFEAVGGFDERFPAAGGEEIDLARRLFAAGGRVRIAPEAGFDYTARTDYRSLMRQRRAYALGWAILDVKAGRPRYRPHRVEMYRNLARVAAGAVRHRRGRTPAECFAPVFEQWCRLDSNRQLDSMSGDLAVVDTDEFVVMPGVPVVGGLAFAAPSESCDRRDWSPDGAAQVLAFALLERLTNLGDVVVDWRAGVGSFAVAAALHTGPTGCVVAAEPDRRLREMFEVNALRHGMAGRVTVGAELELDAVRIRPVSMLRADSQATDVEFLEVATSMLESNADMVLVVEVDGTRDGLLRWARGLLERLDAGTWCALLVTAAGVPIREWSGALVVLPVARAAVLDDFSPVPYDVPLES